MMFDNEEERKQYETDIQMAKDLQEDINDNTGFERKYGKHCPDPIDSLTSIKKDWVGSESTEIINEVSVIPNTNEVEKTDINEMNVDHDSKGKQEPIDPALDHSGALPQKIVVEKDEWECEKCTLLNKLPDYKCMLAITHFV